jgi:hypothetical protein
LRVSGYLLADFIFHSQFHDVRPERNIAGDLKFITVKVILTYIAAEILGSIEGDLCYKITVGTRFEDLDL